MRCPGSTHVGVMRDKYELEVEPRPSRFMDRVAYLEWCIRADKVGRLTTSQ